MGTNCLSVYYVQVDVCMYSIYPHNLQEFPAPMHIATDHGMCVDPAKVKVIKEMTTLKNEAGVQWLLGLVQYLSKFLPYLSDIMKPL